MIVVAVSMLAIATVYFNGWGIEFFQRDYIRKMCTILPVLMPYAFFICLIGVIGGVLNYSGSFVLPALGALLLNIFLLGGLGTAWFWNLHPDTFLLLLAVLTPLSGVVQLGFMFFLLCRAGIFPLFGRASFSDCSILRKLWNLMLPGMIGYAALQISFLIDRTMAATLGEQAVPALTYVDRIVDLPIGIFAVSLGTVLMAAMSRAAAAGDESAMSRELVFCLRHVWFICLPLAFMVIFFHEPVLRLLCLGGRYGNSDLDAARMVAVCYGAGIPFFCSLKVILPAFYARKKMKTPLFVSLIAITVNIVLNFILMRYMKQGGIALATVAASLVHNTILLILLKREGFDFDGKNLVTSVVRSLVISGVAAYGVWVVYRSYLEKFALSHWGFAILTLLFSGAVFGAVYFSVSYILRGAECRELLPLIRRKSK